MLLSKKSAFFERTRGIIAPRSFIIWGTAFAVVVTFLYSLAGCAPSEPRRIESHFSTPESTVCYYWNSLAAKDYRRALSCFSRYRADTYNEQDVFPIPDVDSLRIEKITGLKFSGRKRCVITYNVSFYSKNGKRRVFPSGDHLILTPSGWKIDEVISSK